MGEDANTAFFSDPPQHSDDTELAPRTPTPRAPDRTPTERESNVSVTHPYTPPDDSSYVAADDTEHKVDSFIDEEQVRAHLQDVESSFLPPMSPIQIGGPDAGIDDTYLFDAVASKPLTPHSPIPDDPKPPSQQQAQTGGDGHQEEELQRGFSKLPPKPSPGMTDASGTTKSHDHFSSSPTTAATARHKSRAISMASRTGSYGTTNTSEETDNATQDDDTTHASPDASPAASPPSLKQQDSETKPQQPPTDAGNIPENTLNGGKRPKYLRSRNASQRSSTSSFHTNDDAESDVTVGLGTDYALHSGGAVPAMGLRRSVSNTLSRSISMGSMASGFDETPDSIRPDPLEPLEEVDSPMSNRHADLLTTPRAKKEPLSAPTDTVIARHVRDVEVPEYLAKQYKAKGGISTPSQQGRKPSSFTPGHGTARKNLTLREQSSTIERLTNENFDLKLKIMFLHKRLNELSEEGVKEMISENVDLKTSVAFTQRDNKLLRRKIKDLEKRLAEQGERPSTARSGYSSEGPSPASEQDNQDREDELIYLREQVEEYVTEIDRLKQENMSDQIEKRRLAETVKTMGDHAVGRAGESLGRQEEADLWKDLLEQETARREQADEDNRKLRDENFRMKQEAGGSAPGGPGGMMHTTTNIYNITRKARQGSPSRSRPMSQLSGEMEQANSVSQSSTLVEELRRESEQLRHENAELRREVGAQTSMLTSRNREKERLYLEIEDLKLAQRRGGPAPSTLDSLLDRSASRAGVSHERPTSRGSARTRLTLAVEEDPEREELENKLAEHRDKVNELKFRNQELQRELEKSAADFEQAAEGRRQAEEQASALQEELENAMGDLIALQAERDEALQEHSLLENEFDTLRREAQEEIDALEAESDQKSEQVQKLHLDLQDRAENFDALQEEMRSLSEALVRLENEQENKLGRIEELEQELAEANKELEDLETKLLESNDKNQRLIVQQENGQDEIAFLREEQEGDKIRIGDLEAALANAEQSIRDERDRTKELEQRLANERKQREIVASREKEEIQQFVNELNREMSTAKDEARKLRKNLTSREVEAAEWKERLMELESNLREALGDLNGTRSSLLNSIAKLQRELEKTVRELDTTKNTILEKDRIIKQRDGLLESHGLESRRLSEMLEKERQAHRNTKNQFETFQRTHQHVSRTVTSQDSRIVELETSRAVDKKRITQLEAAFKEQLAERNSLLLDLWTRLSSMCGSDWAHDNSLINGRALPSAESISTMLPGFTKNLLAAIKTIEATIGNFRSRVKSVERDLWKEYQSIEHNLEVKTKKLERLETIVRSGVASSNFDSHNKIAQLEAAYRALKIEHATLQRATDARSRSAGYFDQRNGSREDVMGGGSPSPSVPTGPMRKDSKIPRSKTTHLETTSSTRTNTMTPDSSHPGGAEIERVGTSNGEVGRNGGDDRRWMLRLRELESKLKQEREARNLDRSAARQRIQDSQRQNTELAAELARAKRKGGGSVD